MLPPTPPNVTKYGTYSIDLTCMHLGCCRDSLRKKTEQGKIRNTRLDDDSETIIIQISNVLSQEGIVPALIAGVILAGIIMGILSLGVFKGLLG